jgi:hypothetical protein
VRFKGADDVDAYALIGHEDVAQSEHEDFRSSIRITIGHASLASSGFF